MKSLFRIIFALSILYPPVQFAEPVSRGSTNAVLNAINTNLEDRFIKKNVQGLNENMAMHNKNRYESEPMIFGTLQRQKTDVAANINGYSVKSAGVGYLFDYDLPTKFDLFEVGVGATYADSHAKTATTNTLDSDSGQILGYANLIQNGYFVGLFVSGTESWNKSKRVIPNTSMAAHARYKGAGLFSKIRFGRMIRISDWQFVPEMSLRQIHIHQKSYNESDAGVSNLSVSASSANGTRAGVGGRAIYIQPHVLTEFRVFYFRDLKNPILQPSITFLSNGAPFLAGAQNNKKNNLNLGAGLTYFVRPELYITGNYDFLAKRQGYTENNASFAIVWQF